jgi:SAM-dependent methyltransferase
MRCPVTGQPITPMALSDAERISGRLYNRVDTPYGKTETVLLRNDHLAAYPVAGEVPILLAPEALTTHPEQYDLRDPRWSEAYDEMAFYNGIAAEPAGAIQQSLIDRMTGLATTKTFPSPEWLNAGYDAAAQLDAYRHLGNLREQRIAQLVGKGIHAVMCLVAGAAEAWLITPMHNEVIFGFELARRAGVGDRFRAVVAVAEQIPFEDSTFDRIYSGGCLHHMTTDFAVPEIRRVLVPGGRFAAVEPWQTVVHQVGTRIVGKREANAFCKPLNEKRLGPMRDAFDELEISHHGPVLRYLALGLLKLTKRPLSVRAGVLLARVDDALPLPKRMGGSVAVLATRPLSTSE